MSNINEQAEKVSVKSSQDKIINAEQELAVIPSSPYNPLRPNESIGNKETPITGSEHCPDSPPPIESKKYKDSIAGGAFMLANMCFGTTIFCFACRCKQLGLIWFLIILILGSAANYWTMVRMVNAARKVSCFNYSDLVYKVYGKGAGKFIDAIMMIYSIFVVIDFTSMTYQAVGHFTDVIFYNGKYDDYSDFKKEVWEKPYFKFPIVFAINLIIYPMCVMRDLSKINFAGYLGVGACGFAVLVVVIECHKYYHHYLDNTYDEYDSSTHINYIDMSPAFTKRLNFFKGCTAVFYAYACHTGVFPVYDSFNPSEEGYHKFKLACFFASVITSGIHEIAVITSYLTDPYNPQDLVLFRQPLGNGYDVLMSIAKMLLVIALIFSTPTYYITYRISMEALIFKREISKIANIISTLITLLIVGVIAVSYTKILNYISYIGGFLAVIICYLFPILLWIKTNEKGWSYWLNIIELIGAIALTSFGYIAGITTIIDDAKGY